MSSTLLSQVESTEINNETKSELKSTLSDLAGMFTMWAVTAATIVLVSLSWVA